jgi:hypothetical protein
MTNANKNTTKIKTIAIVISALVFTGLVYAHGDEDHSKDEKKKESTKSAVTSAPSGTAALAAPQRLSDGSLFIPKSIQRQLGIRTEQATTSELSATVELNGKIIADPDTGGRVQATFAGTISATDKGMPSLGRKVVKGEVLAYLRPIDSAIERGNQRANLADLDAQLDMVSRRLVRYEKLASVVPLKELESTRIESESLKRRRDFVSASLNANEPLRASATGTISASYVVAGQVVDAKEVLFEIVDTSRLAVEALAYDASLGSNVSSANAIAAQTNQSNSAGNLSLKYIGSGQQLRDQALPMLFRIQTHAKNNNSAVAVGQPVKVIVRTSQTIQGAQVNSASITKTKSGETMVWVHKEAERFIPIRVKQQSLDANTVAITQGLHEGDRVVVLGTSLLSEVR